MAFEIVPHPHLPPHRCVACGCTENGDHIFIPTNAAWEFNYVFICRRCVEEMATALGITNQVRTETVEVVRKPTDEEMLLFVAGRFNLTPIPPSPPPPTGPQQPQATREVATSGKPGR